MNRRELDELMQPRELPDQHRMLREVFGHVSQERARAESADSKAGNPSTEPGFSDSAFRPIVHARSRRWLSLAVAAATVVVVGGLAWSVVIQSPLSAQVGPGGQPVPPTPTPHRETTPTLTPAPRAPGEVVPPSVTVMENRTAGRTLFITYRVCSGSGVATLTGPFTSRDSDVELPAGMPPRMTVHETLGPDECVLRGEAIARPNGPVSGRLDVRATFEPGTPETRFNAYYGDIYGG